MNISKTWENGILTIALDGNNAADDAGTIRAY